MQELRANTQVKVIIGPAVAVGDGFTPVTTLDLSTADEAELFKHDAAAVTSISAATFAAITSADGYYNLTLTTSLTDTEGLLTVCINDDSLILPIMARFMVLSEAAWDSKFVAKDDGFMDVNIKTIGRSDTQETEATNLEAACAAYSATRGLTGTALPAAAADAAGGLPISDAGGLDLDAKLANTNEVTAARMGALTDWIDGGRLDLLLDGTKAKTDSLTFTVAGVVDANALRFSGSATAADNAEVVFDTDFAANYDATNDRWKAVLADGVTHGGTTAMLRLGSSTSTAAMYITNSGGPVVKYEATGGNGIGFYICGEGAGDGIYSQSGTTSGSALNLQGGGTGSGINAVGGATGSGITAAAGATSGYGATFLGRGNFNGVWMRAGSSATTAAGLLLQGKGSGSGLDAQGGLTGHGFKGTGGGTSGDGMNLSATDGDGLECVGAGTGFDIVGDINGTLATLTTYTGNTVQSGDAFARLGAPAGASVSADVAAVKVDTGNLVTRITSTLFSGITSLAHWLGLMAGKQTANSTALTEIKATGAGSGTYSEATDSLEALRDRGDAAWITADVSGVATAAALASLVTTVGAAGAGLTEAGGDGDHLTAINLPNQTMDIVGNITGNLSGSVGSVTGGINTTAGVITTLDALDTAQDTQHSTTQGLVTTVDTVVDGIAADLPARITKNVALANFMFKMVDSTDHVTAETGLTITATRSLDGAAFAACANSASEVASGWYKLDLAAADLNANVVVLRFTGTGADTNELVIVTQNT